jgi:hypothetical protein
MPHRVFADREEQRFGALILQRLENRRRIAGPRTVVESQHDLAGLQEIVGLELFRSEARSACGVDFNHTRYAERILTGCTPWGSFVSPR